MLSAVATGCLDHVLNTTQYFWKLEQTGKAGVSFLLREAFTHPFATQYMNLEFLLHVASLNRSVGAAPLPAWHSGRTQRKSWLANSATDSRNGSAPAQPLVSADKRE